MKADDFGAFNVGLSQYSSRMMAFAHISLDVAKPCVTHQAHSCSTLDP
jgi:hypothetical protein